MSEEHAQYAWKTIKILESFWWQKAYLIKRQTILETQNVELATPLNCVSDFIKVIVFQNNQSEQLKN